MTLVFYLRIGQDRAPSRNFLMHAMQFSSGDVVIDRRFDYARMLDDNGDSAAAADLMEQALEMAPLWTAGWLNLAHYREKAGDKGGAIAALQHLLALDPEDIFAAKLKLALLGAVEVPDQPPTAYVEALFDDYAERFEDALVEKLDYSIPEKLGALLERTVPSSIPFVLAVDLGCGTGLLGSEIRGKVDRLEGFDLSANMLAKAEEKAIYDHLGQADLTQDAAQSGLFNDVLPEFRASLACAADVMIYLGNLEAAFELVMRLTSPRAVFAFSVEDSGADEGFDLAPSLRYRHSKPYVETLLGQFGFETLATERTAIRKDGGEDVPGILFVARKHA